MEVYACLLIVLIKGMINLSWIKESHAKRNLNIKGQLVIKNIPKLRFLVEDKWNKNSIKYMKTLIVVSMKPYSKMFC